METQQTPLPRNLLEAVRFFADLDVATAFAARFRWAHGPTCPRCQSKDYGYLKSRRLWRCKGCRHQYSVKVGTFMEDSPLGLDKWMVAIWMVANCKNGVSSHEMARSLGITQKSAWFMLHRVRLSMEQKAARKLAGEVEADESYVGGRGFNMHKDKKAKYGGRRGIAYKTPAMGMLERDGLLIANVVKDPRKATLQGEVRRHIAPGSALYSDALRSYTGLETDYDYQVVDHARAYVEGRVHTNGLENFWSLLKRSLKGTHVYADPSHLHRYVDEQVSATTREKATTRSGF